MPKILIIDDEPEILRLTKALLQKNGYNVEAYTSGVAGLKRLETERPDLILLDVMLHPENGWDICRKIKDDKRTSEIPVVMFTVRGSDDDHEKSEEVCADAHISKPFEIKDLLIIIKRLLK